MKLTNGWNRHALTKPHPSHRIEQRMRGIKDAKFRKMMALSAVTRNKLRKAKLALLAIL
jgi:hypothetical protein